MKRDASWVPRRLGLARWRRYQSAPIQHRAEQLPATHPVRALENRPTQTPRPGLLPARHDRAAQSATIRKTAASAALPLRRMPVRIGVTRQRWPAIHRWDEAPRETPRLELTLRVICSSAITTPNNSAFGLVWVLSRASRRLPWHGAFGRSRARARGRFTHPFQEFLQHNGVVMRFVARREHKCNVALLG